MLCKELLDFENYLLHEEEKNIGTVKMYCKDVSDFLDYFKDKIKIKELKKEDIKEYQEYLLKTINNKVETVNRKSIALHRFLTFLQITVRIRQYKTQNQNFLEGVIDDESIDKMYQSMLKRSDYRAVAIMMTLKMTGMRVSEMLQLTVDDINKDSVMIVGKGNKRRYVFISKKLRAIWQDYCKVRLNKSEYLFTGKKGRINRNRVYTILNEYGWMADIDKRCNPHIFRHKFVISALEKNIELTTVSSLVGHSNVNTTAQYGRKSLEELLNIIEEI
jgi:integrase/recombinase XerD